MMIQKLDQNERNGGAPAWVRPWLDQLNDQVIWGYPQRRRAEEAWANHLGVDSNQIILTNGSDEAIGLLFSTLAPRTPVILPLPAFGVFIQQCSLWPIDARILPPTAGLLMNREAIERELLETEKGLVIITRPNNPTGECIPLEVLRNWLSIAAAQGTTLLCDEAYIDFSSGSCLNWLNEFPNLLVMRTLSKAYGLAGFRIGILIGQAAQIEPIRQRVMPFNLSSPAVELACAATSKTATQDVRQYTQSIIENRNRLAKLLRSWQVDVIPSQANFLLLHLGQVRRDLVAQFLATQGIAVRRFDRPELQDVLRITIPLNLDPLIEPLKQALSPELICLDVDGCLMDVSSSFDRAIHETVAHFTGQAPQPADIIRLRRTSGFNNDFELSRQLILERGLKVDLDAVTRIFEKVYWGNPTSPGTVDTETPLVTLETMTVLNRYQLAMVTGRNRRELQTIFRFKIFQALQTAITSDDVESGKPDPEGIVMLQKQFKTKSTWMVGDNLDDILAAVQSGSLAIGIGTANRQALLDAGATIVLDDINQIRRLLS